MNSKIVEIPNKNIKIFSNNNLKKKKISLPIAKPIYNNSISIAKPISNNLNNSDNNKNSKNTNNPNNSNNNKNPNNTKNPNNSNNNKNPNNNNSNNNKNPKNTNNSNELNYIPLELPMKPVVIDPNTEKLKFRMYKEGILLYRFDLLNNILLSMKKIIKTIQTKIKKDYTNNIKLYKEQFKSTNKKNEDNNIKLLNKLIGYVKNNYSLINKYNSSKLKISSQNKNIALNNLVSKLTIYFKETPLEITKNDKITLHTFLQDLLNHLYFLFNIDLSIGNNEQFKLNNFYNIIINTIHDNFNSNEESTYSSKETKNENKIKFQLYRNGLLLYRLEQIQNILESIIKVIKKIQQNIRIKYKINLNNFKLKNNNLYHISYFSNLLGTFKNHFNKIKNINPKMISLSNNNKKEELQELIKKITNNLKNKPKEITEKNKIQIEFILQELIENLYYLFQVDLKKNNKEKIFKKENFYNIILESSKK